jgi:hypothetical protein
MEQRQLEFKDFAAVRTEVDRLHRGGWVQLGQWDLAQVCDHLRYFIQGSLDGFTFRAPWILKTLFGRMMLRRILTARRMKSGMPTPQKPLPATGSDEAAAVTQFKEVIDRFDANRSPLHASPFFGELTPEQWREMHLIHCAHHLAYLAPKGLAAGTAAPK